MNITDWLTTELHSVFKGMLLGLLVAAPVGPIGILCIQRTLLYGWRIGLLTGLGAASADGLYAAVAAFGLISAVSYVTAAEPIIRIIGGMVVLWIGVKLWRSRPATHAAQDKYSTWGAYGSTVLLTLSNPLTILSFIGLFGASGITVSSGGANDLVPSGTEAALLLSPGALAAGVLIGSACWWLALSSTVQLLRLRTLAPNWMQPINRLSGASLILLGVLAIGQICFR
ncbi:LysE family translocator [Paenibacillus campi]|uniref:LysE family translocator n=1 Tax=Paenibacillus campi TaxID=3106031 RepID=UPI002AFF307C|nr:LysE family transporter [Paenibacillus sp. SGZ-1014]